ncbi:MFS transporter [Paraburkholderia tropica]|uniref:MFS transporter n=1 Tax=Paraburkholderia tropica TaxID=92647 RepID=UPI002AB7ED3D|nr:MFS transporter [Paraburkholderia tropica]
MKNNGSLLLSSWSQIRLYVFGEACVNVAVRALQIYCTWLFIKKTGEEGLLAKILIVSWVTSLVLLPVWGVMLQRYRKERIILLATLLCAMSSWGAWIAVSVQASTLMYAVLLFSTFLSAIATSALFPVGTPILAEISSGSEEVHRAIRLKSAMFIVNLLCGPTLAGLMIGQFGGTAALILSVIASVLALALVFIFNQSRRLVVRVHQSNSRGGREQGFFRELYTGVRRVFLIKAELTIALASLFANMLYVPFLYLLLPSKILGDGFSMFDLAIVEISLGVGVTLTATYLIKFIKKKFSAHGAAILGMVLIGSAVFLCANTKNLILICLCSAELGVGLVLFNVTVNSRRAVAIPVEYFALMESTLLFICTAAAPLGIWISQQGLHYYPPDRLIVLGSEVFLIAIATITLSKPLRRMLNGAEDSVPYYLSTNRDLFDGDIK